MQSNSNKEYWGKEINRDWFTRQFKEPYRITVAFQKFLESCVHVDNEKILDLGCGAGAVTSYFASQYPNASFVGVDINDTLFQYYEGVKQNVVLEQGDWYHLDSKYKSSFDGVISHQTLSWLPEIRTPLQKMCELNPKWIAFSSLLYEGKINYTISLENYERISSNDEVMQVYYNIYSIPLISKILRKYGYNNIVYQEFEMDVDIKKPDHNDLGYYTLKTFDNKRIAFNTCLYQPEYFLYASKA